MITLGIETSCDETSVAVLKGRDEILSNVISSSLFRHRPFGGVVPEIASRHCLEQIDIVYQEALEEAKVKAEDLDLIAVTQGPGLIGSILVGVSFAKALSLALGIPLIGVNHLEAHLVANFIGRKEPGRFLGLLVSGGHTILSFHEEGKVAVLGSTVDDAAGEAFDKVAKILGLGYPGGPLIEKLAREGNPAAVRFTMPRQANRFDFSFSGIKTAVLYHVESHRSGMSQFHLPGTNVMKVSRRRLLRPLGARNDVIARDREAKPWRDRSNLSKSGRLPHSFVCDVAASFQMAVVKWLVEKTLNAAREMGVQDIVVGGGVSANQYLKKSLTEAGGREGVGVWFPDRPLALDNAAMVARRGIEIYEKGKRDTFALTGIPNLKVGAI